MTTATKISAWGNSFGVRLPRSILIAANVKDNEVLDVRVDNGSLILTPQKGKTKSLDQLLKKVRPLTDSDIKAWTRMKPIGREVW